MYLKIFAKNAIIKTSRAIDALDKAIDTNKLKPQKRAWC